jgi:hypothetical protein
MLRRLSDPFWFQAFGCVLGFDWHSSGVTTTVTGALKEGVRGLEHELGFYVGGKGATSRRTPGEIVASCERLSLDPEPLVYASRMAAQVDSAAVQDGFQLYHHAFFFTAGRHWAVVQQGMSDTSRTARRYHWLSQSLASFVNEPHEAICSDVRDVVRRYAQAGPRRAGSRAARRPRLPFDEAPTLDMPSRHALMLQDLDPRHLHAVLLSTYRRAPDDFETLLGLEGVGPRTLRARARALVSEVIYGTPASTRDPARFAFAHGGKDGTPYPVDRVTYDRTIDLLHRAMARAQVDRSDKVGALKRLSRFAKDTEPGSS